MQVNDSQILETLARLFSIFRRSKLDQSFQDELSWEPTAAEFFASVFSCRAGATRVGRCGRTFPFVLLNLISDREVLGGHGPLIIPSIAAFMMAVGLVASIGPARRGLQICSYRGLKDNG